MSHLDNLIDLAGQHARHILVERGGPLMPSWVLFDEQGDAEIIGTPWRDDRQKWMTEKRMRRHMREQKIISYSVVVEAWAAEAPEDWKPGEALKQVDQPRERVDRWEIVVAIASDGQESRSKAWKIIRDWQGKVITLEPEPDYNRAVEGWMCNMLQGQS